jgi:4-amino-4-deoxy-L-arabinose transferase-like glycosyltransferase
VEVSGEELVETIHGHRERSAVSPRRLGAPAHESSAKVYIQYLLFALCAAVYLLPFMPVIWKATDEGTFVTDAVRILHGQVFARDFFEVMGPGSFYLLAGFFKLFGATFLAERVWLFVTSFGTFLSMYFLSRQVCGRYAILPPALLVGVYFSTFWPMVNHHVDSNFFSLLAIVCIILWHETQKKSLLVGAGVLAGVTTCILQPKGMLLLLAFLVWLYVRQWRQSSRWSSLCLVAAGYFCVVGLTLLYFWHKAALWDLIYMNFVWPSQHYSTVNTIPYAMGLSQFWTHWVVPIHGVRWGLPLALVLILPFLFVVVLPALVVGLGVPRGKENLRPEILLYWLCGWAMWLSEFHRRDIAHLSAGSPLLILLCVYFLTENRGKIAESALQLFTISACALAVINLFIVLCAHPVPSRVGTVATFKPDPVRTFLDSHVARGTEIFSYPYCPMYYFLSDTTNPTRYSLLIYNYNTPSQFQEVIRVLDQRKVKYVLWDSSFQTKAAANFYSAKMYRPAGGFILEPYLESHYRVVQDVDGMRIMERKVDNHGDQR